MKKITKSVIAVFSIFFFAFALASCSLFGKHEHSYSKYNYDQNTHFQYCDECGAKGSVGNHTFEVSETAPTCITKGVKTSTCSVCGYTKTEETSALGHNYETHNAVEATCCAPGNIAYKYCSRCQKYYDLSNQEIEYSSIQIPIDSSKHNLGSLVSEVKATCISDGHIAYYECKDCHKRFDINKLEVSNIVVTKSNEFHNLGNLVPATEATCISDGNIAYYHCDVCNKFFNSDKQEISASSIVIAKGAEHHNYVNKSGLAATCTTPGYQQYQECTHCHNIIGKETIGALGHNDTFTYAYNTDKTTCTCTATCSRCSSVRNETKTVTKSTISSPTCTSGGKYKYTTTFTDLISKVYETTEEVGSLGHNYTDISYSWDISGSKCVATAKCSRCTDEVKETVTITSAITKQPTCEATGTKTYTATFTNSLFTVQTKTESINALGHNYGNLISKTSSTCTTKGVIAHYECSTCHKLFVYENSKYVEKTLEELQLPYAHTMEKVTGTPATCIDDGIYTFYVCSTCNRTFLDELGEEEIDEAGKIQPALGHQFDEKSYDVINKASDLEDGLKVVVAYTANNKWYAMKKDGTFVEATVKDGSIALNDNYAVLEINSSDKSGGFYSIFWESGLYTNKFIAATKTTGLYNYADCTSYNNARWKFTVDDSTGLLTIQETTYTKGYLVLGSDKKIGSSQTLTESSRLYLFKEAMNCRHEVRMEDGSIGVYYDCARCGRTFDPQGNKIKVTSTWNLITNKDVLNPNDQVILYNQAYNYVVKKGSVNTKYETTDEYKNGKLTDVSKAQTFTVLRGKLANDVRFKFNDGQGYLCVQDAEADYTLVSTANAYTSVKYGSFQYKFTNTSYPNRLELFANEADYEYKWLVGKQGNFYFMNSEENAYGQYTSRFVSFFREEFKFESVYEEKTYVEPTCTEYGMKAHILDTVDNLYYDLNMKRVSYESLLVDPHGHNYVVGEHVFGTDTHTMVCTYDPTHTYLENCEYGDGDKCIKCGADKNAHRHVFSLEVVTNEALYKNKTCADYAQYYYSCSCGAVENDPNHVFFYEEGGKLAHTLVEHETLNPTCTDAGYVNRTYCDVCGEEFSCDEHLPALGHDYDNGDFTFDDLDDPTKVTGTWHYECSRCDHSKDEVGDITTRPGSSSYSYEVIGSGKFNGGDDMYLGKTPGFKFNTVSLADFGRYFYKQLFIACEDVLDNSGDYEKTTFTSIKMYPVLKSEIDTLYPDDNKYYREEVGYFLRTMCEWFKSDHPEYYFLNADSWSYGYSASSTTVTYSYSPCLYKAFFSGEDRATYQAQFEEKVAYYQGKYLSITDERLRMKAMYIEIMESITYTYGYSEEHPEGTAVAPNTILPLIDGHGVCESYALSLCYIARMNGMVCIEAASSGHAWAYAKVNDKWYFFDPTWGDTDDTTSDKTRGKWFGWITDTSDSHIVRSNWIPLEPIAAAKLTY